MAVILLVVQTYLAVILGVSGLAKAIDSNQFASTLYRQRILPFWSIKGVSRSVPWLEVGLAILLVLEFSAIVVNLLVLTLFSCFLIIEIILLNTKRSKECGCYGAAYQHNVDAASVVVSSLFVGLAGFSLWGTLFVEPVSLIWRAVISILFGSGGFWLIFKIFLHRLNSKVDLSSSSSHIHG
jgi:hypothetical protein